MCGCKNPCRTHKDNVCGMPAKLKGWPSDSARRQEGPSIPVCIACGGELVTRGWALRADPSLRTGG